MVAAVGIVADLATEVAGPTVYLAVEVGKVAKVVDPTEAARPIVVVDPIATAVQVAMVMMVVDTDPRLEPFLLDTSKYSQNEQKMDYSYYNTVFLGREGGKKWLSIYGDCAV
jgi:hypothetical protein